MALVSMCFSQEGIGQKAAMVAASTGLIRAEVMDVIVVQPANFFYVNPERN